MRVPTLPLWLLLVVVGGLLAEQPLRNTPEDPAALRIEKLIQQLGSDSFEQREQAARGLEAIGPVALEALRKADKSDDSEIRRAAAQLVGVIEQQAETAGLLAPRRFRLQLKEISVAEAVAELSRRSGYAVALTGDLTALAQRKVTLQTEETSFWDALKQLCNRAGLEEVTHHPVPQGQEPPTALVRPLLLQAGIRAEMPTHVAGSVRVRALSAGLGEEKEGTVTASLELAGEPRLHAFHVTGVPSITTAIDENGRRLQVVLDPKDAEGTPTSTVVVRLQTGEKACTRLRELTGRLRIQTITTTHPFVSIEKVLAAAGQSFKGVGPTLHVRDVVNDVHGTVRLTVGVETDKGPFPGRGVQIRGGAIFIRGRGNVRMNANAILLDGNAQGVNFPRLFDSKGKEYHLTEIADRYLSLEQGMLTQNATLVFKPSEANCEPARLVLYGQKTVTIEVPFTLQNVPVR